MFRNFLVFGVILITFSGCFRNLDDPYDQPNPDPLPELINENPIAFDNPKVGQKSFYKRLSGNDYFDANSLDDYAYSECYISLEIKDQNENGFLIEEVGLPLDMDCASNLFESIQNIYMKINESEVRFYHPESDKMLDSRFFQGKELSLPIELFSNQMTDLDDNGWKTPFNCICDTTAYDPLFELFGTEYEDVNVLVNDSPMQYDGSGQTTLYNKAKGIIRILFISPWTDSGIGWDLLGKE